MQQQMPAIILSLLILHGLLGKMASLRTFFSKTIHAGILRQLTGIWDRAELIQKFGDHDEEHYFTVTKAKIFKARHLSRWIFGNMWIEFILVAASLYIAMGNQVGSNLITSVIIGVGFVYFLISSILTFRHSVRSKAQFEEEIDVLRRKRMKRFEKNLSKENITKN